MSKSTEEFISNVSLLEGHTVKERYKNFMKLLNKTKQSLHGEERINLALFQPTNPLEEIFKIEAAIYLGDHSEIIQILKSENVVFLKRILRAGSSPLLNDIFEDITEEEFLKLFSHLSLNTKLKVLNRLVLKNAKKAEKLFELIRVHYGLYMASKLITCCSGEFIVRSLQFYKMEITCGQLMKIIKKYPKFIEEIIDALHDNYMNDKSFEEKYKKVFVYLMKNHLELFLKLQEKYSKGEFCLGHRASKSFLREQNKKVVTENSNKFYKHLKTNIIYKNLSREDFDVFYRNLFPKSSKEFKEKFEDLLKVAGHSQNVNLIFKMFKSVYGCHLESEFINVKLLEIMSPDDREALMENYSRPKEIYEDHWVSFMRIEQSLPILKEKISLTSNIKSRAKIVPYLVLTCKFNNDMAALSDVCKYMSEKHRNDHWRVRQEFLKTIKCNYNLANLQKDHWEAIYRILEIGFINKEFYYEATVFQKSYLQFRLNNGLSITEQLRQFIQLAGGSFEMEGMKCQKEILTQMYDLIKESFKDEDRAYTYVSYLTSLSKWNKKHPDDKFVLYSYTEAMDHLKSGLKKDEYHWNAEAIILECLKLGINDEEKKELLDLYFSCKISWWHGSLFRWLTDNEPMFILEHADVVTKTLLRCYRMSLWQHLKYYSHLGIPQKVCELLKQILEINQKDDAYSFEFYEPDEIVSNIKGLSCLLSSEEFLNLIQPYYPTNTTIDVLNEDDKQKSRLLKAISVGIRDVFPCSQAIEPILRFCKGDYLNLIQKSLYLVAYNVAENKLQRLFDELSIRAVSVRKHPVHLASKILNKNETYSVFKKFKGDKNSSIRKCLLKATFNFFCNNPHEQSWELLKEYIEGLNRNDQEALDVLIQWKKIPKSFYEKYITLTWDILENISEDSSTAQERKAHLLDLILVKDVIQLLPTKFILKIIKKYFLYSQKELYSKVNCVTVKYVIYCNSQVDYKERLDFVFEMLNNFCKQSQEDCDAIIAMHKKISEFINEICINFSNKGNTLASIRDFIALYENTFEVSLFLEGYLQLHFTSIYVTSKTPPEVSKGIQELYKSLVDKIGLSITESFREVLSSSITHLLLSKEEDEAERNRYVLINEIRNGNNAVLVVFLLPDEKPTFNEFKLKYNAIIQYLFKEQDSTVQVYLHKYLKSLNDDKC